MYYKMSARKLILSYVWQIWTNIYPGVC